MPQKGSNKVFCDKEEPAILTIIRATFGGNMPALGSAYGRPRSRFVHPSKSCTETVTATPNFPRYGKTTSSHTCCLVMTTEESWPDTYRTGLPSSSFIRASNALETGAVFAGLIPKERNM